MKLFRAMVFGNVVIFSFLAQVSFASPPGPSPEWSDKPASPSDTGASATFKNVIVVPVVDQSPTARRQAESRTYMRGIEKKIDKAWVPPVGEESKRVVLMFKIDRNGNVSDSAVEHSSGVAATDQAALKAIQSAAPFPPPPAFFPQKAQVLYTFDRYARERQKKVFEHF